MNSQPAGRPKSNAGVPAPPTVEVRLETGELIKRLACGAADHLVSCGWAEWIGSGRRRHVRLTASAPLSALHGLHGRDGTRPVRASGTMQRAVGQLMGEPKSHREFIPLSH